MSPATLIAVTAAGYFVDIYDLLLFSIVRVQSLKDLGLEGDLLLSQGVLLMNLQMAGLLIGGLFWGILGDRKGRLAVLFGSILTYSSANLLNAGLLHLPPPWALPAYGALRLIAGIGLAGELGAAVTLVTEVCSKERRGLATAFVASMGIAGAVFAGFVAEHAHWTHAYLVGGMMGLVLLLTRVRLAESSLFQALEEKSGLARGDWWSLLIQKNLRSRYLGAIAQGMPIWFVVGVLLTFSPEIGKELRITTNPPGSPLQPGRLIMFCYAGAVVGDFLAGVLSQLLKSRRKAIASFLALTGLGLGVFVTFFDRSFEEFCWLAAFMGFASGYWAVLLSSTAEQFGTNLRSTVTSTVPNFIRATVIPMSWIFFAVGKATSLLFASGLVAGGTLLLAAWCLSRSRETFGSDLDFDERDSSQQGLPPPILFFDGECNLCNHTVDFLVKRGMGGKIRFASLQGKTAQKLLPAEYRAGPKKDLGTLVLLETDQLHLRSPAVFRIGVLLGGPLGFLAILAQSLVPRALGDWGYDLVAKNRMRWLGRRPTCRLALPHEREWFLE